MIKKKKERIRRSVLFTSVFPVVMMVSVTYAEGLKPLAEVNRISSFQIEEEKTDEINRGLEIEFEKLPITIEIDFEAAMQVPKAGIEEAMPVHLSEKLSGWYHDDKLYVLEGERIVTLGNEKQKLQETLLGNGEKCYLGKGPDWKEEEQNKFLKVILGSLNADIKSLQKEEGQIILDWILPEADIDYPEENGWITASGEQDDRIITPGEKASEITYHREYDYYQVKEMSIAVHKDSSIKTPEKLREDEIHKLETGLYDSRIRQDLRDYVSGEENVHITEDGNPYVITIDNHYIISIESWEGAEHTGGYDNENEAYLTCQGIEFRITKSIGSVKKMMEYEKSWAEPSIEGSIQYQKQEIPYLVYRDEDLSNVRIMAGMELDEENMIEIGISQKTMQTGIPEEEYENILSGFLERIHVTKGIKRNRYLYYAAKEEN